MGKSNRSNQRHKKNIAIVGHLVRDRIIRFDGYKTEAPGGIAYSLAASGAVADTSTKIFPVCNVGRDMIQTVAETYDKFPAIDLSAIRVINRPNKIHELSYQSEGYRRELNIGAMPIIRPLLFRRIPNIDIAWLNYIGGDEFPPKYIKYIKSRYKPLIYMDYHSLSLGKRLISKFPRKAERFFRYNPHWSGYVSLADIVQMNYIELKSILPGTRNEIDSIIESARIIQKAGPQVVIITREDKELIVVEKKDHLIKAHTLEVKSARVVDPTGCGDSLGAGFIAGYIRGWDVVKSCQFGLELAHKKVSFSGLGGFTKLKLEYQQNSYHL